MIALWVIALLGTLFKFVFIHRFQKLSLAAYLAMGWLALLVIDDMQQYLSAQSLTFLIIGGLAYTVGALFYALKRVRLYPRYLAHICIDRRRITFSVYLSLRDLIISFFISVTLSELKREGSCFF